MEGNIKINPRHEVVDSMQLLQQDMVHAMEAFSECTAVF
jgi:hypothetical protein